MKNIIGGQTGGGQTGRNSGSLLFSSVPAGLPRVGLWKKKQYLLPALAAVFAALASAGTVTLAAHGVVDNSLYAGLPNATPFDVSVTYDPATPSFDFSPSGYYGFHLTPGLFTGTFQGIGSFTAQITSSTLYTAPLLGCFNGQLVPCSVFEVYATLTAADRTGALAGVSLDAIELDFVDYTTTLVSPNLPGAPFPNLPQWSAINITGFQSGAYQMSGPVTELTSTQSPAGAPEPSTLLLLGAGLLFTGGLRWQRKSGSSVL